MQRSGSLPAGLRAPPPPPSATLRRLSAAADNNPSQPKPSSSSSTTATAATTTTTTTKGTTTTTTTSPSSDAQQSFPYPLTFLVTQREVRKLHFLLARARLVPPPPTHHHHHHHHASRPSRSSSASNDFASLSATPTPSAPSTPFGPLPPRLTSLTQLAPLAGSATNAAPSSTATAAAAAAKQPTSSVGASSTSTSQQHVAVPSAMAPELWLHDDALPLAVRTALRAGAVGLAAHLVLQGLLPALLRRKSPRQAVGTLASRAAARTYAALFAYSLLFRVLSRLLSVLRLALLDRLPYLAPSDLHVDTHRARAFARAVRALRSGLTVPFFAALAASPATLLVPASVRSSLALYALAKAWQSTYAELRACRAPLVRWVPEWVNGALVYAVGNGQLLYAFLFEKYAFPDSYAKLILARSSAYIPKRPSALPAEIPWPTPREIADHVALLSTPGKTSAAFPSYSSPILSALTPSPYPTTELAAINPVLDYAPSHPSHTRLVCALLHPNEPSCSANFLRFWASEWRASARFVALFLGAANVVFGWRKWARDPERALFGFALAVVQGATVISGSIGSAWALTCFFQQYLPRTALPRARYFLNGLLSSVFILAVPASRRAELGNYVGRMSLLSTWQILERKGKVRSVRFADAAMLSLGLASLLSLYEARPHALDGVVATALRAVVGPRTGGKLGLDGLAAVGVGVGAGADDASGARVGAGAAPMDAAQLRQQLEAERRFREQGDFAGPPSPQQRSRGGGGNGGGAVGAAPQPQQRPAPPQLTSSGDDASLLAAPPSSTSSTTTTSVRAPHEELRDAALSAVASSGGGGGPNGPSGPAARVRRARSNVGGGGGDASTA